MQSYVAGKVLHSLPAELDRSKQAGEIKLVNTETYSLNYTEMIKHAVGLGS